MSLNICAPSKKDWQNDEQKHQDQDSKNEDCFDVPGKIRMLVMAYLSFQIDTNTYRHIHTGRYATGGQGRVEHLI